MTQTRNLKQICKRKDLLPSPTNCFSCLSFVSQLGRRVEQTQLHSGEISCNTRNIDGQLFSGILRYPRVGCVQRGTPYPVARALGGAGVAAQKVVLEPERPVDLAGAAAPGLLGSGERAVFVT